MINTAATKANTTYQIFNASGNAVTASSTNATDLAIWNTFSKAITTNGSLTDNREGQTVTVTTLDISKIQSALTTGGALSDINYHIVYLDDVTANQNGPANRGIELVNGYNMPADGLTVVSPNPVYIQGDYNTAGTSAQISSVPSNESPSNPLQPQASGYARQPCAVMADSVTILSNNWDNADSEAGHITTASSTTINTAILSGIVTSARSGSGQTFIYSGGAENFLRLLENWGGCTLTYYGSLVKLFKSKQATGVWQPTGNYYQAPSRQWYFDVNFYNTPPPGTFKTISYMKSRWFLD
jgi:hypothetical protein